MSDDGRRNALDPSVLSLLSEGAGRGKIEGEYRLSGDKARPTDRRRQARMTTVTFSDARTLERLRALAVRWGWRSNTGAPNVSRVIEELLLPRLAVVEREEEGGQWL